MRALIIGMAGPAIQAVGIAWEAAHILLHHMDRPLEARHIAFEPAMLVIFVGFLVTAICVPAALEVARAAPEELQLAAFGVEPQQGGLAEESP